MVKDMFLLPIGPWVTCMFRCIQVIVACWPVVWHPIAKSSPKSAKPKPWKPNWNHMFEFLWLLVFSYRSPSPSHLLVEKPKFLSDLLGIGSMGTFPAIWSQDGCHGRRHSDLGPWSSTQTSASVMSEISKKIHSKEKAIYIIICIYIYIYKMVLHCSTKSKCSVFIWRCL